MRKAGCPQSEPGGKWRKERERGETGRAVEKGNRTAGGGTAYKMVHLMTTGETGSCPREDQARAPSPCSSSCLLTPHLYCPVCLPDLSLLPLFPACILPKVSACFRSPPLPFSISDTCVTLPWSAPFLYCACHGTVLNTIGRKETFNSS